MSRLRLIETEKFLGYRDRDSSRLGNLMDVETETSRDWAKDVDTETPLRVLMFSVLSFELIDAVVKCTIGDFIVAKDCQRYK